MTVAVKRSGWTGFAWWAFAFAVLTTSVLTFSIGMFFVPVAIALIVGVARRIRFWPEGLGALAGIGVRLISIPLQSLGLEPCPASGSQMLAPGQTSACDGFPSTPWFVTGLTLLAMGVASYAMLNRPRPNLKELQ